MDVFVTLLPGALSAYIMNLTLVAAAGAFVLLLLAQRQPAAATADLPGGSHVAAHKPRRRDELPGGLS